MVNTQLFKLDEIPQFSPTLHSAERMEFWRGVKRRIVEGERIAGIWCPPPLWYGINFHNIDLEDAYANQSMGLLSIRDIDWDIYYNFEEARGFSGFANLDTSSNRLLLQDLTDDELKIRCTIAGTFVPEIYGNLFKADGTRKDYVPAKEAIRKAYSDPGKALYFNDAKNYVILGGRGFGKTVLGSVLSAHNFITDGVVDYDRYLIQTAKKQFPKSTTLIGSEETKFVATLQSYIKKAFNFYPGSMWEGVGDNAVFYPSPISKTIAVGSDWKLGAAGGVFTNWGTTLYSRVFADNVLAANSLRPNLSVIDEFGLVQYLESIITGIEGSSASKARKNNVMLFTGTGGKLKKGTAAKYGEALFTNPEAYNCLVFDDIYEGRGKIGYFLPITHTSMKYKDANLQTMADYALKTELAERKKLKTSNARLTGYIINNPLVPSECFLLEDNNKFPSALLKEHLAQLKYGESQHKLESTRVGWLKWGDSEKLYFQDSTTDKPILGFPFLGTEAEKKGAIQMFEEPIIVEGSVPRNRYIAGIDPVDQEKGRSFPCIWIKDLITQRLVCKYMGRTQDPKWFYEVAKRIILFYNAKAMYENNLKGFFMFMDNEGLLRFLAETPQELKSKEDYGTTTNVTYGIKNMGSINEDGLNLICSYILKPQGPNTDDLMYLTIKDPEVLEEMIKWTEDGNFDSLSALIMLVLFEETTIKPSKNIEQEKRKDFAQEYYMTRLNDLGFRKFATLPPLKENNESTPS